MHCRGKADPPGCEKKTPKLLSKTILSRGGSMTLDSVVVCSGKSDQNKRQQTSINPNLINIPSSLCCLPLAPLGYTLNFSLHTCCALSGSGDLNCPALLLDTRLGEFSICHCSLGVKLTRGIESPGMTHKLISGKGFEKDTAYGKKTALSGCRMRQRQRGLAWLLMLAS